MAIYTELLVEQGCTFFSTIEVETPLGSKFNLNGYSASAKIKRNYTSRNTSAEFEVTIPDPERGIIGLALTSDQTAGLRPGRYVFDVVVSTLEDSQEIVTRVLEGQVEVTPKV